MPTALDHLTDVIHAAEAKLKDLAGRIRGAMGNDGALEALATELETAVNSTGVDDAPPT